MPSRRPPTADDIAREAARQLGVEAMRKGPVQDLQRLLFQLNAGTLFQPRVIVGVLFALGGGAFTVCAGVVGWVLAHR
ncbi:MAG: hypothetical protein ACOZNI_23135 [Myxococcota bacterium]